VELTRAYRGDFVLGGLAASLYVASFFFDAAAGVAGWQAFIWSVLLVVYLPMWLANPVAWIGFARLLEGRRRSAGGAGLLAVLLAFSESWLFFRELRVGYFLWVGSMAVLAVAGLLGEREGTPTAEPDRTECLPSRWWMRTTCLLGRRGRQPPLALSGPDRHGGLQAEHPPDFPEFGPRPGVPGGPQLEVGLLRGKDGSVAEFVPLGLDDQEAVQGIEQNALTQTAGPLQLVRPFFRGPSDVISALHGCSPL
jgi:hypothetical protein